MVVLCLGLGIGVNTTIFSLYNAALLTAPTGREPERLVQIEPGNSDQISYPNYKDLGRLAGFDGLALSARVAAEPADGRHVAEPVRAAGRRPTTSSCWASAHGEDARSPPLRIPRSSARASSSSTTDSPGVSFRTPRTWSAGSSI